MICYIDNLFTIITIMIFIDFLIFICLLYCAGIENNNLLRFIFFKYLNELLFQHIRI